LLKALRGELQPVPSIRSLANAYRKNIGERFRDAFHRETGCDYFEVTPTWFQLYVFADCMQVALQERYEDRAAINENTPGGAHQ
jgi:hypothetical protein